MPKAKKTTEVIPLLVWANLQLARHDEFATPNFKSGIIAMLEKLLQSSGNYKGYSYNNSSDCEYDTPGYYNRHYYCL